MGPAQWRLEAGLEIPTHENGKPRSPEDIMLQVNQEFELAVRKDPANWFWVHKRWKTLKPRTHGSKFRVASQPVSAESPDVEGKLHGPGQS
jgi:lauroyl/myristoyl acyltransferase